MKNKRKKFREGSSIMLRTWIYFVIMTLIILTMLWGTELILFKAYFRTMKENEIQRECVDLAATFDGTVSPEYMAEVEQSVLSHSMRFSVFTAENNTLEGATEESLTMLIGADPFVGHDRPENDTNKATEFVLNDKFVEGVSSASGVFSYRLRSPFIEATGDAYTLVTGLVKNIDGVNYYFCVVAPMIEFSTTTSLLTGQLVTVSILTLILSVMLSYAFSRNITRPISEYAETARRMGKGEKVVFKEVGLVEYDELARALNNSNAEIRKTETMRRDFLANVSHDLRTPLTMVKAYAEMIRDISGKNEKKRTEHCGVIIDEVDRLTLLVNDILDLSRIQSGTRQPELKATDISTVLREVIKRFAIYQQDGYNFITDIKPDCSVITDERMVEQICYNLIGNAVNYSGERKTITVKVSETETAVRVEITDSGKGIAPVDRDKVWERYYRNSETAKRITVGTGLGLSIVKNLYEVLGAKYGIESEINEGSTFWFELKKE